MPVMNIKTPVTTLENLSGSIERVTFHSAESGFCVLKVKVEKQKDLLTVVGTAASVHAGLYIECEGTWANDRQFGLQFKAQVLKVIQPTSLEGVEKYLGSGLVKGIGPHFAKKMVQIFGIKVFEIIETKPERLKEVQGFGKIRTERVVKGWAEQKDIRDIVVFLQSYGVGTARAVRIYKTYGKEAITLIKENPYRLALDIHGIGFKTADTLAQRLGIAPHSLIRAEAGVRHVLQDICSFGHCCAELNTLIERSVELLTIPSNIIQEAIQREIKIKNLVLESQDECDYIFLMALFRAEVNVVKQLKRLMLHKAPLLQDIKLKEAVQAAEKKTGLKLAPTQIKAVEMALLSKVMIITGGPGVGKTTVVKSILSIISLHTQKIALCAPTGRAAKRLQEATGLEAKTVHRLLEYDPHNHGFKRNEEQPLEADWVVIDETSMIDIVMMNQLLKAIPSHAGLLLVGDSDQLPSVGPGAVLANLMQSQKIATAALTEIFRQAKTSKIITNAHLINQGKMPQESTSDALSDFYFIEAKTPEAIHEKLVQVVSERIPKRFKVNPVRDIQVLVPMNRGGLGARALNIDLQKILNPNAQHSITRFGWTFGVNDKVIQTVNNYDKEVFNGDIGFITAIDMEENTINIDFEGREVIYDSDELDELTLAYATTIHKAQGSEYPVVVIPLSTQHFALLERNLLYTGVTRGKSLVVIIGQKQALHLAIRTVNAKKRLTNLVSRLTKSL